MTLEVYIDGTMLYRIANWIPARDGDYMGDGRLFNGEWLDTIVTSDGYERVGNRWSSFYHISIAIPTRLRLDRAYTLIDFLANPWNIDQPSDPWFTWLGSPSGIGPSTVYAIPDSGIRWVNYGDVDNFDSDGTSWRLVIRLYFTRISHLILRDPASNNIMLRTDDNHNKLIMHDA